MSTLNYSAQGIAVSAAGCQQASPASVAAAAAQASIELTWKQTHPNQVYARAWVGGNIGGEG